MPVQKYLDLSTAHLTPEDWDILDNGDPRSGSSCVSAIVHPFEYGYYVSASAISSCGDDAERKEALQKMSREGLSPFFAACLLMAHEKGCERLLFDRDAMMEPSLPIVETGLGEGQVPVGNLEKLRQLGFKTKDVDGETKPVFDAENEETVAAQIYADAAEGDLELMPALALIYCERPELYESAKAAYLANDELTRTPAP